MPLRDKDKMAAATGDSVVPVGGGKDPPLKKQPIRGYIPLASIDRVNGWTPGAPDDPNVGWDGKSRTRAWSAINPRCTCIVPISTPDDRDGHLYKERQREAARVCTKYGVYWRKNGVCRTNPKLEGYVHGDMNGDEHPPPRRPKRNHQRSEGPNAPPASATETVAPVAQRDPCSCLPNKEPLGLKTYNLPGCSDVAHHVAQPPGPSGPRRRCPRPAKPAPPDASACHCRDPGLPHAPTSGT